MTNYTSNVQIITYLKPKSFRNCLTPYILRLTERSMAFLTFARSVLIFVMSSIPQLAFA